MSSDSYVFIRNIHGLASQIRFLLELAGADYEEKYYDEPDKWFKEDKENLGIT